MPLSVDYKEKFASVGRFPGGFTRREGKSSDYEILVARLIDRALRPLFPADFHADVFVTVNLISADPDIMPAAAECGFDVREMQPHPGAVLAEHKDAHIVFFPAVSLQAGGASVRMKTDARQRLRPMILL